MCYTYNEYVRDSGVSHNDLPIAAAWELCQADEAHFELEHGGRCNGNALAAESFEFSLGECADTCHANPNCDYFDYAEAYEEIDMGLQTCDKEYKFDLVDKNVGLEVCKGYCKQFDCKYFYWQSAEDRSSGEPLCHLYSSCAKLRIPSTTGRNFRLTKFT